MATLADFTTEELLAELGSRGANPQRKPFQTRSQADMLALPARRTDVAERRDFLPHRFFVLQSDSPTTLADWFELGGFGCTCRCS